MTIREFYEGIGSNYDTVLLTLMNDKMASRFALRFLNDKTYDELMNAVEKKDVEASFAAAHMLKGLVANLGFQKLQEVSITLCEQLRPLKDQANPEMVKAVQKEYDNVIAALLEYKNSNGL